MRKRVVQVRTEIADNRILQASSQQCCCAHSIVSSWMCGKKVHSRSSVGSQFYKFFTLWFLLFPKLKLRVKGSHFQTLDSIQKAETDATKTLTKADFQSCYEAWKIRWAKCVASGECYFEGDSLDLDE
jgi:hypothetical protein